MIVTQSGLQCDGGDSGQPRATTRERRDVRLLPFAPPGGEPCTAAL